MNNRRKLFCPYCKDEIGAYLKNGFLEASCHDCQVEFFLIDRLFSKKKNMDMTACELSYKRGLVEGQFYGEVKKRNKKTMKKAYKIVDDYEAVPVKIQRK